MMAKESPKSASGFRATRVRLRSAIFRVADERDEALAPVTWNYALKSTIRRSAREMEVTGGLTAEATEEGEPAIEASVIMSVDFAWGTPVSMPVEEFARTNAPAFLWPYLREFVWNLTVRAGQPPLLLPVLNFAKAKVVVEEDSQGATNGEETVP